MQNERKSRASYRRMRKEKEFGKKQSMVYFALIFFLFVVNIVILCKMQAQIDSIHSTLGLVLNQLEVRQDMAYSDGQTDLLGDASISSDEVGNEPMRPSITGNGKTELGMAGTLPSEYDESGILTARNGKTGSETSGDNGTESGVRRNGKTGADVWGNSRTGLDMVGDDLNDRSLSGGNSARYDSMRRASGVYGYAGCGFALDDALSSDELIQPSETDYVSLCGLSKVDVPVRRSAAEVLVRLRELGEDNEDIAEIYNNHKSYPENLLGALANNPEMTDFVSGYLTSPAKATGEGLTDSEKEQEYPLFLQWDPRWGYAEYGDHSTIGVAGCGPVCLSMALYYLLEDESLTPDVIADYSMKKGYYVSGTGTAWSLLTDVPTKYGVTVTQPSVSEQAIKKALDEGSIVICSMKPGDFTAIGHFIVIYGYDEDGFKVNDPNCVARSREQWLFSDIGKQIKHIWVLEEKKTNTGIVVDDRKTK